MFNYWNLRKYRFTTVVNREFYNFLLKKYCRACSEPNCLESVALRLDSTGV